MNEIRKFRYSFGRYDRITINGSTYRYAGIAHDHHKFQLVTEELLEDYTITLSDRQIHNLIVKKQFRTEEAYYSKALAELRLRQDNTDLSGLDEEDVRTIFWKREWCVRFNRARAGLDGFPFPLSLTHDSLEKFIEHTKDDMARWYFRRYGEHRRRGRPVEVVQKDKSIVLEAKPFDYPGATALRNWLRAYRAANERVEAFYDGYSRCGNRAQLHPEIAAIVERCVRGFASQTRPTRNHIHEDINVELRKLNLTRDPAQKLKISTRSVNKRIARLNPFMVHAGRFGPDSAIRAFAPAGRGQEFENFLDRVEIDDWTIDLFALICTRERWKALTKDQKAAIPRVRATVTVGIDCATRCIVALNISEAAPTTAAAKAAVRTMVIDKSKMAALAGAKKDWPMHGRVGQVVTDGGPVFKAEFEKVVMASRNERALPDQDPRMRGYVESVNRTLKAFCRYFTGQSFANVVEKDDYNPEAMTSLTFDALRDALIVFIVDLYHHRKHRGLAGITPYAMWETLTNGRRQVPMDPVQQLSVFGLRRPKVSLDKHGVLIMNISYWSPELGLLRTMVGERYKVDVIVDPDDLGHVLVEVPRRMRGALRATALEHKVATNATMTDQYLLVPSVDATFHGMTIGQKAKVDAQLRAAARAAQEAGESFRLDAHASLTRRGREAALDADISSHLISEKAFNVVMRYYRYKSIGATPDLPEDAAEKAQGYIAEFMVKGRRTGNRRRRLGPIEPEAAQLPAPEQPAPNVPPAAEAIVDAPAREAAPTAEGDALDDFDIPDINDVDGDDV